MSYAVSRPGPSVADKVITFLLSAALPSLSVNSTFTDGGGDKAVPVHAGRVEFDRISVIALGKGTLLPRRRPRNVHFSATGRTVGQRSCGDRILNAASHSSASLDFFPAEIKRVTQ